MSSEADREQQRRTRCPDDGSSCWQEAGHGDGSAVRRPRVAARQGGARPARPGVSAAGGLYVSATSTRSIVGFASSWRTTPGAARDARQRIVGDVHGHLGRLRDPAIEAGEERAAAGEDDALVHDVGHELRWGLLDRVLDRVDDLLTTDGSIASRTWSAPTSTERGSPVSRSRPRSVTRWASHSPG